MNSCGIELGQLTLCAVSPRDLVSLSTVFWSWFESIVAWLDVELIVFTTFVTPVLVSA